MRINQDVSGKILDQANKTLQTWIDDQLVVLATLADDARVIEACAQPTDAEAVARANDFLRSFHEKNGFYEMGPHIPEIASKYSNTLRFLDEIGSGNKQ